VFQAACVTFHQSLGSRLPLRSTIPNYLKLASCFLLPRCATRYSAESHRGLINNLLPVVTVKSNTCAAGFTPERAQRRHPAPYQNCSVAHGSACHSELRFGGACCSTYNASASHVTFQNAACCAICYYKELFLVSCFKEFILWPVLLTQRPELGAVFQAVRSCVCHHQKRAPSTSYWKLSFVVLTVCPTKLIYIMLNIHTNCIHVTCSQSSYRTNWIFMHFHKYYRFLKFQFL
jgi:hypothetical protein